MQTLGRQPTVTGIPTVYDGRYTRGKSPEFHKGRYSPANRASWSIIEAILSARGEANFWDLAAAVRGHKDGSSPFKGPQSFVRYCVRREWLKKVINNQGDRK